MIVENNCNHNHINQPNKLTDIQLEHFDNLKQEPFCNNKPNSSEDHPIEDKKKRQLTIMTQNIHSNELFQPQPLNQNIKKLRSGQEFPQQTPLTPFTQQHIQYPSDNYQNLNRENNTQHMYEQIPNQYKDQQHDHAHPNNQTMYNTIQHDMYNRRSHENGPHKMIHQERFNHEEYRSHDYQDELNSNCEGFQSNQTFPSNENYHVSMKRFQSNPEHYQSNTEHYQSNTEHYQSNQENLQSNNYRRQQFHNIYIPKNGEGVTFKQRTYSPIDSTNHGGNDRMVPKPYEQDLNYSSFESQDGGQNRTPLELDLQQELAYTEKLQDPTLQKISPSSLLHHQYHHTFKEKEDDQMNESPSGSGPDPFQANIFKKPILTPLNTRKKKKDYRMTVHEVDEGRSVSPIVSPMPPQAEQDNFSFQLENRRRKKRSWQNLSLLSAPPSVKGRYEAKESSPTACPLCNVTKARPLFLIHPCYHQVCNECFMEYSKGGTQCPRCYSEAIQWIATDQQSNGSYRNVVRTSTMRPSP